LIRQRGNRQLLRVPPNVHQSESSTAGITQETLEGTSHFHFLAPPTDGFRMSARVVRIGFTALIHRDRSSANRPRGFGSWAQKRVLHQLGRRLRPNLWGFPVMGMGLNPDVDSYCAFNWNGRMFRRESCRVFERNLMIHVGRQRSVWSGHRRRVLECRPTSASETRCRCHGGGRNRRSMRWF